MLYKSVFVNEEKIEQFRNLSAQGVELIHPMAPNVESKDFMKTLNSKAKN
jgi:mannose/fructose/N-acetylgalactosamine-specific phosphotransferase system component IIB